MPRPVDPKLGQDGYEVEPAAFVVDPRDVQPLLELFEDQSGELTSRLAADLSAIGTQHHRWKDRGANAFSRAEARKALDVLLATPPITSAAVTALNERALLLVVDRLTLMKLLRDPPEASVIEMLYADRFDHRALELAAKDARQELLDTTGPETDIGVMYCVRDLCDLFEALSGNQATLSNRDNDRGYTPEPRSPAARFVHACYRLIDKDVRNHQLNGHMRGWIEQPTRS
ncbi:MAG: hypothetical protein Q8R02_23715 [Hyphomonadaceae bacterium]|nr:hypothetical protein [Hyphomonadaceae bacterium]